VTSSIQFTFLTTPLGVADIGETKQ